MDKLTKENFWDQLGNACPEAMLRFREWIDQYKKDNAWQLLFGGLMVSGVPKYHNLPYAMQVGIFLQFVAENQSSQSVQVGEIKNVNDFLRLKEIIREYFFFEESNITV